MANRQHFIEMYVIRTNEAADGRRTGSSRRWSRDEADKLKTEFKITSDEYMKVINKLKKQKKGVRSLYKG